MTYRNNVTGAVIETYGVIAGGGWTEVKACPAAEPAKPKGKPVKNTARKKAASGE